MPAQEERAHNFWLISTTREARSRSKGALTVTALEIPSIQIVAI